MLVLGLQPIPPRLFEIPDHGRLRMAIPLEWKAASQESKEVHAVTVRIQPNRGDAFDTKLTTIWLDAAALARMTPDTIKSNVKRSGDGLLAQATDKSLIIEELKGGDVSGFYYTLGDSDPKPGEYRYITQGSFLTGNLLAAFTIMHHQPNTEDVTRVLRMLAGSRHVP